MMKSKAVLLANLLLFTLLQYDLGGASRPFVDHPTCPRKPDLVRNRKCLKKCRSDLECRGRNRRCVCDDVCGKSCVKPSLKCESLKTLFNGKFEMIPYNTFGAKVRYHCNDGYRLLGLAERVCQGDGYWYGEPPVCQKDSAASATFKYEGKCRDPPSVDYALHDGATGQKVFPLGTQLTYSCTPGYSLDGFFRAMCVGEGRWVGPRMTCSPRRCGHPGDTPNGQREGNVFVYPNRVKYTCVEGYELIGRPYRTCGADGQWSGTLPMCRPVRCPRLNAPVNGQIHGTDSTYGAVTTFTCMRGFRLEGSPVRKCQQDGKWSGNESLCNTVDCGRPGPFYNGYLDGEKTTFDAIIVFRCFGRSTFDGPSPSSRCLETGEWSHPAPICWSKCELLSIPNGTLDQNYEVGNFVTHGTRLHYVCNSGFVGEEAVPECRNGTWTHKPKCLPAPCVKRPAEISNGIVRFHSLGHGDRAKYKCNTGFKLAGDTYLTCQYGNWTGATPSCKEVHCKYPGTIDNGQVLLVGVIGKYEYRPYAKSIVHNVQIEYHCDKEFKLVGPAAATCVDGQWSPENKPLCVQKQHPRPLYIYRGRRSPPRSGKRAGSIPVARPFQDQHFKT